MRILQKIGQGLARYLSEPRNYSSRVATATPAKLLQSLLPGDVLLVDGNSKFSTAIKYLTQSSWSHAALFVGDVLSSPEEGEEPPLLIEADINEGVRAIGISLYAPFHTRICRPVGLHKEEIAKVVNYAVARLGYKYDLRNIIDLARYFLPTPPIPHICSSLIAQAFQSINYPILPEIVMQGCGCRACIDCRKEILHIRHHSLFTPRDFDVSPYFQIIKPTLESGFDPHTFSWGEPLPASSDNVKPVHREE